jgi:EAL domain-containing protein (putative c-di-GMP-specific phosphodiesterase class I)
VNLLGKDDADQANVKVQLQRMGSDPFDGFLLGKPMPADAFGALLRSGQA